MLINWRELLVTLPMTHSAFHVNIPYDETPECNSVWFPWKRTRSALLDVCVCARAYTN